MTNALRFLALFVSIILFFPQFSSAEQASSKDQMNLIIISLDTVRPDHLSLYGYHRKTTPNIDALAADAHVFSSAFMQVGHTIPSHLSVFTSKYPKDEWLSAKEDLKVDEPNLTEILIDAGYSTAIFSAFNPQEAIYGFKYFLNSDPFSSFQKKHEHLGLKELPDELYRWLVNSRSKPFFLFLHGFDAHEPHMMSVRYNAKRFNPGYDGPVPSFFHELLDEGSEVPELRNIRGKRKRFGNIVTAYDKKVDPEKLDKADYDHIVAVYDAQIYAQDRGLSKLFMALKNLNILNKTIIVIMSDHGQHFGEKGVYTEHGTLYDPSIHSVFVLRDPRLPQPSSHIDHIVEGIDIMPTVLSLLDLPVPISATGRDLTRMMKDPEKWDGLQQAVSVDMGVRSVRTDEWKLIIQDVSGNHELYNLKDDPGETKNVYDKHPDIAKKLNSILDKKRPREPGMDEESMLEWIQDHGYW